MNSKRSAKYRRYLQSPEWKAKRAQAIWRADGRCQLCNDSPSSLHVHHRTYERLGNEDLGDLTVLCPPCHRKFHDIQPVDRAERRREITNEILAIVKDSGPIAWSAVRSQIKAPHAQSWARAKRLIRQGRVEWDASGKRLQLPE